LKTYSGNSSSGVARVWAARGGPWFCRPQAYKNTYCWILKLCIYIN